MEESRWNRRARIAIAAFLVLVVAIPIAGLIARSRDITPPEGVDTYAEWRPAMRAPSGAFLIEKDSTEYLLLLGDDPYGLLAVASGPPAYAFDRSGRLVDWTTSAGGPPVLGKNFWDWNRSPLPLDQVDAWFRAGEKK